MSNTTITCPYQATATNQSIPDLQTILAGVPIDLSLPRLWGVVPTADATTNPSGSTVQRVIVLTMGTAFTGAGPVVDGGEKASPIRSVTLPGGLPTNYGAPPIVSFPDATGSGATAFVEMGLGTIEILNGGTGYTGVTTVATVVGGDLAPGGVPAQVTPTVALGVVTGITIVNPGKGYNVFPQIVISDTGGGSGAVVVAALTPVGITLQQQGNDYRAPELTLTPFFKSCCPDTADQSAPFKNWMTQVLADGAQTAINALAPTIT